MRRNSNLLTAKEGERQIFHSGEYLLFLWAAVTTDCGGYVVGVAITRRIHAMTTE